MRRGSDQGPERRLEGMDMGDLRGPRRRPLGRQFVLGCARLELAELEIKLVEKALLALRAPTVQLTPQLLDRQLEERYLGLRVRHPGRFVRGPRLGRQGLCLGRKSPGYWRRKRHPQHVAPTPRSRRPTLAVSTPRPSLSASATCRRRSTTEMTNERAWPSAGSTGVCGVVAGRTARTHGGMQNGGACRRVRPPLHCSRVSHTRASGRPPASPQRHGVEDNKPGRSPG